MSKKEHVKLSASKVKTLLDCSWVYWCKYHLKLPDSSNDGAKRGSCVHELFEALTKKRLMSFAVKFQADGCDVEKYKSVHRFLMKRCKKYSLNPDTVEKKSGKTNFDLMVEMVNVGLSNKFFPEEHEEIIDSEYAFDITHDDMNFRMVGFIDKILFDKKNKTLFISDYKSSKMKFAGAELDGNIQAMMYSLAADTLKKNKKIPNFKKSVIRFIFLRFCSNPFQELEFTSDEINGFKHYLSYIAETMDKFTEKDAMSNFAASDVTKRWKCSTKSGWKCPLKDPFDYYAYINSENGKIEKTLLESDYLENNGLDSKLPPGQWEKKSYSGCAALHSKDDFFSDFDEPTPNLIPKKNNNNNDDDFF